jgi:hypothetical protein
MKEIKKVKMSKNVQESCLTLKSLLGDLSLNKKIMENF